MNPYLPPKFDESDEKVLREIEKELRSDPVIIKSQQARAMTIAVVSIYSSMFLLFFADSFVSRLGFGVFILCLFPLPIASLVLLRDRYWPYLTLSHLFEVFCAACAIFYFTAPIVLNLLSLYLGDYYRI